jgi:uncharacterized membrane protein YukC
MFKIMKIIEIGFTVLALLFILYLMFNQMTGVPV